jgi:hypothetical protein
LWCPWTGLGRSKLNELILPCKANGFKPPVRSISVRNRGQVRGVRLIVVDSLLQYLYSLECGGETGASCRRAPDIAVSCIGHKPMEGGESDPANSNS